MGHQAWIHPKKQDVVVCKDCKVEHSVSAILLRQQGNPKLGWAGIRAECRMLGIPEPDTSTKDFMAWRTLLNKQMKELLLKMGYVLSPLPSPDSTLMFDCPFQKTVNISPTDGSQLANVTGEEWNGALDQFTDIWKEVNNLKEQMKDLMNIWKEVNNLKEQMKGLMKFDKFPEDVSVDS